MHPDNTVLRNQIRWSQILIGFAVVAAIMSLFIAFGDSARFFQVYLIGYLFWVEIAVGCLGLVLMNNLINGRWMYPILRIAEAGVQTLPLLAILFIPIIFGLGEIYPWMDTLGELKGGKNIMLTPTFFVLRTFIYIAVWSFLGFVLTNWSYRNDDGIVASEDTMRNFSAVGAIFYVLTTSLAGFDWTQSLVPEFFSSAFGWAVLSRMWLAMMALVIVLLAIHWGSGRLAEVVDKKITNDLGAMLLASFLVWVYFYGIQLVIIYSGNVAFNAIWFDLRIHDGWRLVTNVFAIANIALLVLLLIPGIKGNRNALVGLAVFTLLLRGLELHWVVMPTYEGAAVMQLLDFMPIIAIGCVWLVAFLFIYYRHPLLPTHHPSLQGNDALAGAAEAYVVPDSQV
ncbi:MAG: hypothetical protein AAFV98_12675 [Chloroflexota bacterium]